MLSDPALRSAMPRQKPYKLFDEHQLFVLITPQGSRLWRMNYMFEGKHKTLAFGPYPLVSLGLARIRRERRPHPSLCGKRQQKTPLRASAATPARFKQRWSAMSASGPQTLRLHPQSGALSLI